MKNLSVLTLLVLLAGCVPAPAPPNATLRQTLGEERYFLEVENTTGNSSLTFNSKSSGMKTTDEHYDLSWGKDNSLKIDNGELRVNGIYYTKLEPRDKILIKTDGKVLINGKEAIAPP